MTTADYAALAIATLALIISTTTAYQRRKNERARRARNGPGAHESRTMSNHTTNDPTSPRGPVGYSYQDRHGQDRCAKCHGLLIFPSDPLNPRAVTGPMYCPTCEFKPPRIDPRPGKHHPIEPKPMPNACALCGETIWQRPHICPKAPKATTTQPRTLAERYSADQERRRQTQEQGDNLPGSLISDAWPEGEEKAREQFAFNKMIHATGEQYERARQNIAVASKAAKECGHTLTVEEIARIWDMSAAHVAVIEPEPIEPNWFGPPTR